MAIETRVDAFVFMHYPEHVSSYLRAVATRSHSKVVGVILEKLWSECKVIFQPGQKIFC